MNKSSRIVTAAGLPLLFIFLAIFVVYEYIGLFFLLAFLMLVAEIFLLRPIVSAKKNLKDKLNYLIPFILIIVSAVGISASTTLTRESYELLKDPDYVTSCSISPIVACSPVISSDQASTFSGLPNPLFGIFGYTAMLVAGMTILAAGSSIRLAKWYWQALWLGSLAQLAFSAYLIAVSLYDLGSLCLYCSAVWTISIPLFIYLTLYNFQQGYLPVKKSLLELFEKYHLSILAAVYAVVILMIYFRFDYYWNSLI